MTHDRYTPCPWMKFALVRLSEGRLKGILLWYTERHRQQCPQCSAAYRTLLAMRDALRRQGLDGASNLTLDEERWSQIEAACQDQPRNRE